MLTQLPGYLALKEHQRSLAEVEIRDLFAADPKRFERLSLSAANLTLDYSKNRLTEESITLLADLADQADLPKKIKALFSGDCVNVTESRAAQHMALRNMSDEPMYVLGAGCDA